MYLFLQLTFWALLVPSCRSIFLSGVILLWPERLLFIYFLTLLEAWVSWWWILSVFVCCEVFICLHFGKQLLLGIEFYVTLEVFFKDVVYFKDVAPLSSDLHCFQQEVWCHPYLRSFVHNMFLFLWLLLRLSLSLVLTSLFKIRLAIVLAHVVHWTSWICVFIAFIKFGHFSALISSNAFSPILCWELYFYKYKVIWNCPIALRCFLKMLFSFEFWKVSITMLSNSLIFSSVLSNLIQCIFHPTHYSFLSRRLAWVF